MSAPEAGAPPPPGGGSCPACWEPLEHGRDVELSRIDAASLPAIDPAPGVRLPVVFHAGCSPGGWEVLAGPVALGYALRIRWRILDRGGC